MHYYSASQGQTRLPPVLPLAVKPPSFPNRSEWEVLSQSSGTGHTLSLHLHKSVTHKVCVRRVDAVRVEGRGMCDRCQGRVQAQLTLRVVPQHVDCIVQSLLHPSTLQHNITFQHYHFLYFLSRRYDYLQWYIEIKSQTNFSQSSQ